MIGGARSIIVFMIVAALTVPALAQTGSSNLRTITRGTISATAMDWPDYVARGKGLYQKESLKVEHALISPTTITSSLIGGSIQVGLIGATQLILAVESGADLVAIGKGADPSPYTLVATRSVKTMGELKGKTISLNDPTDVYTVATREILKKNGLDPDKDVTLRFGGNSNQRMAALQAGAVDAVPLVPPQDRLMLDQGFNGLVFYPDYFPNLALSLTAVSRAWGTKNSDVVKSFMRAQAAAVAWLYDPANKGEALQILMKETRADEAAAGHAYDIYVTRLRMYGNNGCIETNGIQPVITLMSEVNKLINKDLPVGKYVEKQWCPM